MRSGTLRHRVRIERATETRDSVGQVRKQWSPIADRVPARINTLSGRERLVAASVESQTTHRITFRFGLDVRPGDRVLCGNIVYNLTTAFDPSGRRLEIVCDATAGYSE